MGHKEVGSGRCGTGIVVGGPQRRQDHVTYQELDALSTVEYAAYHLPGGLLRGCRPDWVEGEPGSPNAFAMHGQGGDHGPMSTASELFSKGEVGIKIAQRANAREYDPKPALAL